MSKKKSTFEIRFLEGVIKRSPKYVDALVPLAEAYTEEGLYQQGLEIDLRLSQLCKQDPTIYYNLACSYALVGNRDEAMKALQHAVSLGYTDFLHMRKDEDLKILHQHPPFEALFQPE